MTSLTKNPKTKTYNFLKIKATRLSPSIECLNSSLAQPVAEL